MKYQKRFFFVLLLASIVANSVAQNRSLAQREIDTLASDHFAGRGYIEQGDRRSAEYIAERMQEIGLQPVVPNYFYSFQFNVNTIPTAHIVINGTALKPGVDFMASPNAKSFVGEGDVFPVSAKDLRCKRTIRKVEKAIERGSIPMIAEITQPDNKQKEGLEAIRKLAINHAIIFRKRSLVWSVSTTQAHYTEIWLSEAIEAPQHIAINIASNFIQNYTSQNVLGYVPGTEFPDSFIVCCGHYDHLGKMGDAVYYGANDNASGIAMILDMASYFVKNPQRYSVAFIAFGGEEAGLIGSYNHVNQPPKTMPLARTKFVFNMDLMGNGKDGATIVNGAVFDEHFKQFSDINERNSYLPVIKKRGKAANSDHYFFSEKGVPSFFIYLMGDYTHYHIPDDNPSNLHLGPYYDRSFLLIRDFIKALNQ